MRFAMRMRGAKMFATRMAYCRPKWLLLAMMVALCFVLLGHAGRVSAEQPTINLSFEPTIQLGQGAVVQASLTAASEPIVGQSLTLSLNNQQVGTATTAQDGTALFTLPRTQLNRAADYTVRAAYEGSLIYGSAQSAGILTVQPALFSVQTVPPLAGIRFALGDTLFVSNESGLAQQFVYEVGTQRLSILLPAPQSDRTQSVNVLFGLWQDGFKETVRPITIPSTTHVEAGFEVDRRVTFEFEATTGERFSQARVDSIAVRDSFGRIQTYPDISEQPSIWLRSTTIQNTASGLQSKPIGYALTSIMVDGSNVLQSSEQRFSPELGQTVAARAVLYEVQISARDIVFGRPLGQSLLLEYPDGTVTQHPINGKGRADVSGLARGTYRATIFRAEGYAPQTTLTVSQNQTVNLSVISFLDLSVILGGVFVLILGWVASTQPHWLQPFGRKVLGTTRTGAIVSLMRTNRLAWTASVTILLIATLGGIFYIGSAFGTRYFGRYSGRFQAAWFEQDGSAEPTKTPTPIVQEVMIVSGSRPQVSTATPTAIVIGDFPKLAQTPTPLLNNAIPEALPTTVMQVHHVPPSEVPLTNALAAPTSTSPTLDPTPRIHLVRSGETLVDLADIYYKDSAAWDRIWQANRSTLGNSPEIEAWDILIIP